MKVVLDDPRQVDTRAELARIDLARAEGQGVAEEMRRQLATEMEALRGGRTVRTRGPGLWSSSPSS
jgi:hypothetical protein